MKFNKLTNEEKRIIEEKGTEKPHSGEYDNFFADGAYFCRRCGAPLYRSEDKFDAHCGWPSFDDEIPGAVKRSLDEDGSRTEITCARCGAHLGHVFVGEQLTEKNTRHCANSLSIKFVSASQLQEREEKAYFAGGCFWCLDAAFRMLKGVGEVISGYAGGKKESPSYEDVSRGDTGHVETVKISYDPTIVSYEALLGVFFSMHDPTTLNRQGADVGTQYRSAIFYEDEMQKEIAERYIHELEEEKIFAGKIMTEIKKLDKFYPAEDYHQNYYAKNPEAAYCQAVINPKLAKLREKINFQKLLKNS